MIAKIFCLLIVLLPITAGCAWAQNAPDTLQHSAWKLYWTNEFNTPGDSNQVANKWRFSYPWAHNLGSAEAQFYSGDDILVDSVGQLHLRAHRRNTPRPYHIYGGELRQLDYESGMLFSKFKGDSMQLPGCAPTRTGFTYGLFEIHCRLPRTSATSSAFWLYGLPDEVDIFEAGTPELVGNNVILWNHPYWRPGFPGVGPEGCQSMYYWPGPGSVTDGFHTFALSWEPQEMVFYFDGIPIRRETRFLPMGCPLDLIANLQCSAGRGRRRIRMTSTSSGSTSPGIRGFSRPSHPRPQPLGCCNSHAARWPYCRMPVLK